jgi:hypothetical protein
MSVADDDTMTTHLAPHLQLHSKHSCHASNSSLAHRTNLTFSYLVSTNSYTTVPALTQVMTVTSRMLSELVVVHKQLYNNTLLLPQPSAFKGVLTGYLHFTNWNLNIKVSNFGVAALIESPGKWKKPSAEADHIVQHGKRT